MDTGRRAEELLEASELAAMAIEPYVESDWKRRAGPLDWDIEQTIAHMVGACAKYTIYLASGSQGFIALGCTLWPDATHRELWRSIVPVAFGLATVARFVPADLRAFHADGQLSVDGFLSKACLELLVHTDDALRGLGSNLPPPPARIVEAIMRTEYPGVRSGADWPALLEATGRRI